VFFGCLFCNPLGPNETQEVFKHWSISSLHLV
jgi:hypothetical protein